jgi:pimeloyl-ACP methyl ester carboxylesterase
MRRAAPSFLVRAGCALGLVVVVVLGWVTLHDPSPLGNFRSSEGRRAYEASYAAALQRLPPPRRTMDVATGFGTVRVYEFAPTRTPGATPAVLLPGRSSGAPMWASNLADLVTKRTVYAMDPLGDAGLSVQTRRIENGADQADWLDQAIAGLGSPAVHLVGHSFGGWLAANYAMRRPERVATLTLVEPVFVFQGLRWQVYVWSLPASLPFLPDRWRDRMLSEIGGTEEVDRDDPLARMISDATQHFSAKLPLPERITDEQLRGLRMPVYAVLGARSSMHDAAAAVAVARACVKDVRAEVWPGASHSLPMEFPERLDREVLDFMAAHDPP